MKGVKKSEKDETEQALNLNQFSPFLIIGEGPGTRQTT